MTALSPSDFPAFFAALWSVPDAPEPVQPFAWQHELLEQVVADGRWPDLIDIPTGLGKTATIDIALFALAIEASCEPDPSSRRLPHRIVMVVDRRVVVDQAHERATAIRQRIIDPTAPEIVARVRDALRSRSAPDSPGERSATPPLLTSVLRGGIVRDETWARRPDVPAVLASTVDQVGSRLLFRGYGLSTGARPIHAGLLGNDTLFLLDEVHLAQPFAETLTAIGSMAGTGDRSGVPRRFGVVQLTATPVTEPDVRFPAEPMPRPSVTPDSVDALEGPDAVVARRIGNAKPADLEVVKVPADTAKANEALAKAAEAHVIRRLADARRVAVMVNRVDAARRCAARLATTAAKSGDFDVHLLTGRMRPIDRDATLAEIGDRLRPGPRAADERPIVIVATQSLEAGADFDFDVLVTECASLDALRQRFGRVDRDGQRWAAGQTFRSVVLGRSIDVEGKVVDPVYGPALGNTWRWLSEQAEVDFGYRAMISPEDPEALRALCAPSDRAPILASSHLDRWCQTSERTVSAEPEVAQWLHGVSATDEVADVHLIWRADLDRALFLWDVPVDADPPRSREDLSALVTEALDAVPPLAAEALAVPVGEARRWLQRDTGDPALADAPMAIDEDVQLRRRRPPRLVARWIDGAADMVPPAEVRPGDTVIVPATVGGIAHRNWAPDARELVADRSADLSREVRGTIVVSPHRCEAAGIAWPDPGDLEDLRPAERRAALAEIATAHAGALGIDEDQPVRWRSVVVPAGLDEHGAVTQGNVLLGTTRHGGRTDDLATDGGGDELSLIGRPMRLSHHLRGVGDHAGAFARALGWPEPLTAVLQLAGEVHDAGKVDSRFQAILGGGTPTSGVYLAKSGSTGTDRSSRLAARRASGYPRGARHELLSLAMMDDLEADGVDLDLVRHLVATHHGWGRYRFRPVKDDRPEQVVLDVKTTLLGSRGLAATTDHGLHELGSGHSERFWDLTRRYGWWTLAQVEAVLRLADHHRSHLEQRNEVEVGAALDEGEQP